MSNTPLVAGGPARKFPDSLLVSVEFQVPSRGPLVTIIPKGSRGSYTSLPSVRSRGLWRRVCGRKDTALGLDEGSCDPLHGPGPYGGCPTNWSGQHQSPIGIPCCSHWRHGSPHSSRHLASGSTSARVRRVVMLWDGLGGSSPGLWYWFCSR